MRNARHGGDRFVRPSVILRGAQKRSNARGAVERLLPTQLNAWAGPTQYLEALEQGRAVFADTLHAEKIGGTRASDLQIGR